MAGSFHGATVVTLDAKGRLAIPTRHRDALLENSRTLVLTAHPDGCVILYPEADWEPPSGDSAAGGHCDRFHKPRQSAAQLLDSQSSFIFRPRGIRPWN